MSGAAHGCGLNTKTSRHGFTSDSVSPRYRDVGRRYWDWLHRFHTAARVACSACDRVSPGADLRRDSHATVRDGVRSAGERRLVRDNIFRRFGRDRMVDCIVFSTWAVPQLDRWILAWQWQRCRCMSCRFWNRGRNLYDPGDLLLVAGTSPEQSGNTVSRAPSRCVSVAFPS